MRLVRLDKIKLAVILFFLLNLIAGLLFINEGIFHYDGIALAKAVENTYKTAHLAPAARGRYGSVIINSIVYLPFFLLGQNADFATRFSSVLFHALSIVALLLFINELFGNFIQAIFASLMLSFTPFYFSPNTYGKEHGLGMFLVLLSFYLLVKGMKKNDWYLVGGSSFIFAFTYSVREAMLIITPLYFFLYLSPQISLSPFKFSIPKQRLRLKPLLFLLLPFAVTFIIIFSAYLKYEVLREIFVRDSTSATFLGMFSYMFKAALVDLSTSVPLLAFVFAAFGFLKLLRKNDLFLPIFLLAWCLLIFYFANIALYVPRYLDIVIIPVYILCAYSLSEVYSRHKLAAIAVVAYIVYSMFTFMYPMLTFRHHYNGEKQYALFVKEKTEKNALVITMDDSEFIEYYGLRKTLNHPVDDWKKMHEFLRMVGINLINNIPVYLTGSGLSYDKTSTFRGILLTNFDMAIVGSKLCEDYHRPELKFTKYEQMLFKLDYKFK